MQFNFKISEDELQDLRDKSLSYGMSASAFIKFLVKHAEIKVEVKKAVTEADRK